jgi:hypothetical protein
MGERAEYCFVSFDVDERQVEACASLAERSYRIEREEQNNCR